MGVWAGAGAPCLHVLGSGLEVSRQRSLAFTSYHGPHRPGCLGNHPTLGSSGLSCPVLLCFLSNLASFLAPISGAFCSIRGRRTADCPLPSRQPCQSPQPSAASSYPDFLNKNQATPSDKGSCLVYFGEERALRARFSGPWPSCSSGLQTLSQLYPHVSSIDPG